MCAAPGALAGQTVTVTGRVLLGGRDTVPLRGAWAVLHHVTREGGGPVDSVRTDAAGRYRLRVAVVDSAGVYVVSTWHDSVAYFSPPVNLAGGATAEVDDLMAYRTSRDAPIRLARRLVTVARPGADGTRDVLEILELENAGVATRITNDTLLPTWAGRVPSGVLQFQAGQGDVSPEAVSFRGDSVLIFGPIPPGAPKQLTFGYLLPAGAATLVVPIDQATGEVSLLLEDTTAAVTAPNVDSLGVDELEQRRFAAYRTGALAAGSEVTIALPPAGLRPQSFVPYVVGALGLAMAAALVWALKRKPSAVAQPSA